jgi:hypothetical protein
MRGAGVESFSDGSSGMGKQVPRRNKYTVLKKICTLFHHTPRGKVPSSNNLSYDFLRDISNPPKHT